MHLTTVEKTLLLKAERFCAYRERCSFEVKQKMRELKADEKTAEKIISSLKEDDFLNDERFARLFTSGKFRIKRWGKNKIRAELRMKKIEEGIISNALASIDEHNYEETMKFLMRKKERELKGAKTKDDNAKIFRFLLSKGFESHLVLQLLNQ